MNDGDLRILEVVKNILTGNSALLIITAAGAECVPQPLLRILRIGRARRNFENTVFGIDLRSRNGNARVEVSNHELDAIGGKFISHRNTLLRIGYVIADCDGNLLAIDAAGIVDFLDCRLGAFLDLCTINGVRAGYRNTDTDQYISPSRAPEGDDCSKSNARKKCFSHCWNSQILFTPKRCFRIALLSCRLIDNIYVESYYYQRDLLKKLRRITAKL
ncbi:predicted protein [Brucella pinnipedialis M163/99/10]|nr:predicted protein [Brucella pinnipedialis M163/99/10]